MVDAQVLARLLLMQDFLYNLPDKDSILSFVSRGLLDLPGIGGVDYSQTADTEKNSDTVSIPLLIEKSDYGALQIHITDIHAYEPYREYLQNFGFLIAVILEERRQRRQIERHKSLLEQRVNERTRELSVEIEQRKKIAKRLEESQKLLKAVMDSTPDPIFVKDRFSRLLLANPAVLKIFGKSEKEVIGKDDNELYDDPSIGRAVIENDRRVMESGETKILEERILSPQGYRILLSSKTPYRDADGEVIGLIGVAHDITERKQVEKKLAEETKRLRISNEMLDSANVRLRELDDLKNDFVSVASHELRTPLTSIIGYTQALLATDIALTEAERKRALRVIEKESKRLALLVRNLLDISRIEKGVEEQNLEEFDLKDLVDETIALMETPGGQSIVVENSLPDGPIVKASRDRIGQVLRNLFDNALRYTGLRGTVTVSITADVSRAIVSVSDKGPGIPEHELSRIFDKFYRVKDDRTNIGKGSGLGLAIAKEIIESRGGLIWAQSRLGQGSTFYFTVPLKV